MGKKQSSEKDVERIRELEEKAAELAEIKNALQEAEDKYRILVENANDAIFVLQDGKIKFANPKALEIAGVLAEELEKAHYTDYLHPEEKAVIVERHEKRLKGEKILHMYPLRIVTRQGTVVWTEVNAVLIEWDKRPATLNIIRDITSQKLMEQQYLQSESMETLRTLSGGLAHSLNNLVNAWQAIPGKGRVVIKTENFELTEACRRFPNLQAAKCIKLSVCDNGVGMDETVRKRAFEPFFTTKSIGKHRGLGLASVYGIVANHHGVVDIESLPGSGTTVSVYLPATGTG